jgi:hypothetical protein
MKPEKRVTTAIAKAQDILGHLRRAGPSRPRNHNQSTDGCAG